MNFNPVVNTFRLLYFSFAKHIFPTLPLPPIAVLLFDFLRLEYLNKNNKVEKKVRDELAKQVMMVKHRQCQGECKELRKGKKGS